MTGENENIALLPSALKTDILHFRASTSKNAILPLMISALLNADETLFEVTPDFSLNDVDAAAALLRTCGARVWRSTHQIGIDASEVSPGPVPASIARKTRYSLLLLGALVSRTGRAEIPMSGGCDIGRTHDYHTEILRSLGCHIHETDISIAARRDHAAHALIRLPYPSVGATLNAILASCSTPEIRHGKLITLENCACEPEVDDVIDYLCRIGMVIRRQWRTIRIEPGPTTGKKIAYSPISDRIETGTYALAAAILGVKVIIHNAPQGCLDAVTSVLHAIDCHVAWHDKDLLVDGRSTNRRLGLNVATSPYPGFPTDLQPILAVLCLGLNRPSTILDTVMPHRTRYIEALRTLGGRISSNESSITIYPDAATDPASLNAVDLQASDLRGGAAAVLRSLQISRPCRIANFDQVRRGYSQFDVSVKKMGGDISSW
ncbi:MAG: hypothetical protein EON54_08375 [Alcaligenaceae bacterium]|nr:MAG: hypothetical protein EON54_08375 [Alcaligenaceae bacterium]